MKKILLVVAVIWLTLWLNFLARDLFKHNYLAYYRILAAGDAEEKHAVTYGEGFYEFFNFAKNNMPEDARYDFMGIVRGSLMSRRGIYYLYPSLNTKDAEYLLVFNVPGFRKEGFRILAKLDNGHFLLKRY